MPASCLNFFKGIKHGVRPGYTAIHCGSWLASDGAMGAAAGKPRRNTVMTPGKLFTSATP